MDNDTDIGAMSKGRRGWMMIEDVKGGGGKHEAKEMLGEKEGSGSAHDS